MAACFVDVDDLLYHMNRKFRHAIRDAGLGRDFQITMGWLVYAIHEDTVAGTTSARYGCKPRWDILLYGWTENPDFPEGFPADGGRLVNLIEYDTQFPDGSGYKTQWSMLGIRPIAGLSKHLGKHVCKADRPDKAYTDLISHWQTENDL